MAQTPKNIGVEVHSVSSLDTSRDEEFELFDPAYGEPRDLGEAIGLAVGAASMTWPVIGGVFRDAKAKRISDALEMYVRDQMDDLRAAVAAERAANEALAEQLQVERQVSTAMDSSWTLPPPPPPAVPPQLAGAVRLSVEEYLRAKFMHGDKCIDGPGYSQAERLAIVMEELGEAAHELTYDAGADGVEGGELGRLSLELVQVAAMVLGWLSVVLPGSAVSADTDACEPELVAQAPIADPVVAGAVLRGPLVAETGRGSFVSFASSDSFVSVQVPRDRLAAVVELLARS